MREWLNIYDSGITAIYIVVECALLIAALLAARHPRFRREFCCFAAASALSAISNASVLLLRLYLIFHFSILTVGIRRGLLITQEVTEVVSIAVYCLGFFALARQVASLPREAGALR
jgi:hypothetical protein